MTKTLHFVGHFVKLL